MNGHSVDAIVRALEEARVRYLIVGGLAVVAHGFVRFTADMDLVLDPDTESLKRAIGALEGLGYRPRAPVRFEEFADPAARRKWVNEKGLTVFSLYSAAHAATEVDLFVEPPFDFEVAYARAMQSEISPGLLASFVARDQLIAMKRSVARPQDLEDARRLELLNDRSPTDD